MKDIVCNVLVQNDEFWLPYALESTKNRFLKYIIYNVGSTDGTENIIDWFEQSNPEINIQVSHLPDCPPKVQGKFRNSMIAEGGWDYYWLLDGDELYNSTETYAIPSRLPADKYFGVIKRKEFGADLRTVYDVQRTHHRLYRREATWIGTHPGEESATRQRSYNEYNIPTVTCYHFHNAERSTVGAQGREKRKSQGTYHPGSLKPINLLEELPILRKPINNFPVAPALEKLQHEH